ncbi:unnamed protein product [Ectocarpus sp. 12 AP-2014]
MDLATFYFVCVIAFNIAVFNELAWGFFGAGLGRAHSD